MVQLSWNPVLVEGKGPMWRRLVDALSADIQSGAVSDGVRLPPQRTLAFELGVSVGTVTRAYEEAERAGLVISHVGRGTFVAGERAKTPPMIRPLQGPIDLARNIPPIGPALVRIEDALQRLSHRPDVAALVDYTPLAGVEAVRAAGARWMVQTTGVIRARPERLIHVGGGQQALTLVLSSLARAGETVLCDRATYPGNRTIAEHGSWNLLGVPSDAEGIDPEALDRAAAETGARLVLLIPTLHNPTTITLSRRRREDIVEVARKRDLLIIEDDIYRVFGGDQSLPTLADLAPERTIHIASLSKALAPGLRLAFVLPPDDHAIEERLLLGQQALAFCPPAAGGLIFAQWVEDGTAQLIKDGVCAQAGKRLRLAHEILGDAIAPLQSSQSLHVWLPMAGDRARQVASYALSAGVEITPPDAPSVDGEVSGLRLCLGAPMEEASVERALHVVRTALDSGGRARGII